MLSKAQQLQTQCLFNLQFSQTGLVAVENVKGPVLTLWVMLPTDKLVLWVPCTANLENWCAPDLPCITQDLRGTTYLGEHARDGLRFRVAFVKLLARGAVVGPLSARGMQTNMVLRSSAQA